ncbi:MAG: energy-coupling factor transporter transmembrane protein EcfT [Clostridia bacterium]|nr:energy-coupling factor transporter transmembrane protein EcfT [Clostridia bacterium]
MFKDVTIGQYIPGNSVLHKMHPPFKIILALAYIVVLFMISKWTSYGIFTLFTAALVLLSKINLRIILKGIKPMLWIIVFTAVINIFMTPGEAVWTIPIWRFSLNITREGLTMGAAMTIRLVYLVIGTSLLTLTTSPLQLTDGIEKLLNPLRVIKVPAHEIAMMMTIAIRFIPTLAEETDKIIKAQTARGADFESGNLVRRAKAMVPILVPLFISAFRRADELATAMEARCYRGGKGRTRMKETHLSRIDAAAGTVFVLCSALVLIAEYMIKF